MRADPQHAAGPDVPETADEYQSERSALLRAQEAARIYAAGRVPGRPGRGEAVTPRRVGGQLLAPPEDRLGQAAGSIAFAVS